MRKNSAGQARNGTNQRNGARRGVVLVKQTKADKKGLDGRESGIAFSQNGADLAEFTKW